MLEEPRKWRPPGDTSPNPVDLGALDPYDLKARPRFFLTQSTSIAATHPLAFPHPSHCELQDRRKRLLGLLGPDALVLLRGARPGRESRRFRQTNEFYYLTGLEAPGAYAVIDGRGGATTVYLPHRDEKRERSDGPTVVAEEVDRVQAITGAHAVAGTDRLSLDIASRLFAAPCTVYVLLAPAEGAATSRDGAFAAAAWEASDPLGGTLTSEAALADALRFHYPHCPLRDLSPHLDQLRLYKSGHELELMRTAARLCGEAIIEAMRSTAVGVREYQLEAVASFVHRQGGAAGPGYEAIVAGGANAWHGHYNANDAMLQDGDLVLMDFAPDYGYYTSDIGRMWPVNGVFEPWQREIYGFVLDYLVALLARIKPGVTPEWVLNDASAAMRSNLEQRRFSKTIYRDACERALSFEGHLSHPVGMAVHDVGDYRNKEFEPGLVFSVDPMIWVPEERLYIRIEDTVALTERGLENLTGFVPREMDEIERLVGNSGLLQQWSERV